MPLPGHMTQTPVPVCKACYKELKSSPTSSIQVRTLVSVPTKVGCFLTRSMQFTRINMWYYAIILLSLSVAGLPSNTAFAIITITEILLVTNNLLPRQPISVKSHDHNLWCYNFTHTKLLTCHTHNQYIANLQRCRGPGKMEWPQNSADYCTFSAKLKCALSECHVTPLINMHETLKVHDR